MNTVLAPSDLVTNAVATISGFAWQAQQKAAIGVQYQAIANYFVQQAPNIHSVDQILADSRLLDFAIGACSLSKKSLNYLTPAVRAQMINSLIQVGQLINPLYVRELEQRFLLTCGDSVGGSMRNIIGQAAQTSFSNLIFSRLSMQGNNPICSMNAVNTKILTIDWVGENGPRRLVFDKKSPIVDKSIDFILLKNTLSLGVASDYVACGELKGGIDPAGADEHWKTARAALNRIEIVFPLAMQPIPQLFFVAAAIETAMAQEIFGRLNSGELKAAANLNIPAQMEELVDTLIGL